MTTTDSFSCQRCFSISGPTSSGAACSDKRAGSPCNSIQKMRWGSAWKISSSRLERMPAKSRTVVEIPIAWSSSPGSSIAAPICRRCSTSRESGLRSSSHPISTSLQNGKLRVEGRIRSCCPYRLRGCPSLRRSMKSSSRRKKGPIRRAASRAFSAEAATNERSSARRSGGREASTDAGENRWPPPSRSWIIRCRSDSATSNANPRVVAASS